MIPQPIWYSTWAWARYFLNFKGWQVDHGDGSVIYFVNHRTVPVIDVKKIGGSHEGAI